jgi:alkylation response protein AidB-like acyl-CoA dehydrogenase
MVTAAGYGEHEALDEEHRLFFFTRADTLYGGSDQIQRNILGERVLGLAREPADDRRIPFRELPKN